MSVHKDQILDILYRNYNEFKGVNEAQLHSAEDISELIEIIKKNTIGEAVDKCIVAAVDAYSYSCEEDRIKNIVRDILSVKTELL
jgi:N-methylhydantoinase A/oxoprolinase/acetone carboxylase beta subunit